MSQDLNEGATRYTNPSYVRAAGRAFESMDVVAVIVAAIMTLGPLCAAAFVVRH